MAFSREELKRIGFIIFAALCGPILTFSSIGVFFTAARSGGWPTVEGKVIGTRMKVTETKRRFSTKQSFWPEVTYEYTVNGNRYTSTQLTVSDSSYRSVADAGAAVRKIVKSENVKVHYDPKDPANALLVTGTTLWTWVLFLMGLGFTAVAFFMGRSYFREVSTAPLRAPTSGF